MPKVIQQDLSFLSSAEHGLVYLTANDWKLISDKATLVSFSQGEAIVPRGKRTHGVYVLLKGTATVVIPSKIPFPAIGPGEVCAEISFLDEEPASVSVVANTAVEAFFIDRPTLQTLIELFPHLGSRFYHSLASSLARRLRDVIAQDKKKDSTK